MHFFRFSGALLLWILASPAAGQSGREPGCAATTTTIPVTVALPTASFPPLRSPRLLEDAHQAEGLWWDGAAEPLLSSTLSPAEQQERALWRWYSTWGTVIGGAVGLAYGLATDEDSAFLDLSPLIETVIGAGIGFLAGTAVYLVDTARNRPPL